MDKHITSESQILQLKPLKKVKGFFSPQLTGGRYLVGRTESCEVIIPRSDISAIHAVIEVNNKSVVVYDMNSRNGTFVNGEKIVAKEVKLGESILFGSVEFIVEEYHAIPELPPVLKTLDPISGPASIIRQKVPVKKVEKSALPATMPKISKEKGSDEPYIIYPLSSDPNSDYSEYIFEDTDELYPIFKYEVSKQAVEVIILFKDKVFSVDYLPEKNGIYKMAGLTNKVKEIEFPYLGKKEVLPFVEINQGKVIVNKLHNYNLIQVKDKKITKLNEGHVILDENDVIKLESSDLEIYVRKIAAPPQVKSAPFFRRDKELRKYVLFLLVFFFLPVLALNFIEIEKDKDDNKDPERIATILYKEQLKINTNKTVAQSEKKKQRKQKAPKKPAVRKTTPQKTQATSEKSNQVTKQKTNNPGIKSAAVKQKVKRVKNPAPKANNTSKVVTTKSASQARRQKTSSARSKVVTKSQGRVEAYKSMNFKSSVSSLMAKGGTLSGAKTSNTVSGVTSSGVSGGVATSVTKANVGTEIGSLTGSTVGKLGESKGTEGLSTKTGVYTAGIPSETVVLGSMDPDVIRRILRDHIPFFRSCYQKELDRNTGRDISGTIRLDFTIGASGHVANAGVDGRSGLPSNVKRCVVGVLRGIKFPRPMGGGTVDVKQPFNFYPKRM